MGITDLGEEKFLDPSGVDRHSIKEGIAICDVRQAEVRKPARYWDEGPQYINANSSFEFVCKSHKVNLSIHYINSITQLILTIQL